MEESGFEEGKQDATMIELVNKLADRADVHSLPLLCSLTLNFGTLRRAY